MLLNHLRKLLSQFPAGRRALGLVWGAAKVWTLVWGALLMLQGLLPAAQVLLLKILVNRLVATPNWRSVSGAVLGIAGVWVLGQCLSSALSWVRAAQAERVQDEVHRLIHLQALRMDLAFFDRADSYDQLHRAQVDAISQPLALLESLGLLVQNGLGFLALAAILWGYTPWLPFLLVLAGVPGLFLVAQHTLHEQAWRLKHTSLERRTRYLDWLITERSAAAELRIFDLGEHHRRAFEGARDILRDGRLALVRKGAGTELLAGLLAWVASLVGLGWMLRRTLLRLVGLGDLLLCFQAFQQGQVLLRALLEGAGRVYRSLLFVQNLEEFLALEPELKPGGETDLKAIEGVRFEGVTFRYPGSQRNALESFDLELPAGQLVAIVGPNGAGKSSLIKLLCRFYDPDSGRILLGDRDITRFDAATLRRQITVLFQDPFHYHATVAENIAFGDLEGLRDAERLDAAVRAAGALEPIEKLPLGMDSVLGKWFGGEELSGGEWQRIALARAFFRQASLVVLDEPTSAMDAWAEQDWLGRFRGLVAGKTALMITHRFTSAMHADLIHVMDHGRVRESGTHAELVAAGGTYARSWAEQMREIEHV